MNHGRPSKLLAITMITFGFMLYYFIFDVKATQETNIKIPNLSQQSLASHYTPVAPTTIATIAATPVIPAQSFVAAASSSATAIPSFPEEASSPQPATEINTPAFHHFVTQVADGAANTIRGVYVENVLALPVVQQPSNDVAYVSTNVSVATLFQSALENGVTGFLAHNYLAGSLFYNLVSGQEVRVVYGDGTYRRYQIFSIDRFEKLSPNSLRSELIDLSTGQKETTEQVFSHYYRGDHHVVFQTCLEKDGVSNWGLIFIAAKPL